MEANTQVNYTICLNTLNDNNLTRHEKTIHKPLVTGTIEYHSTVDVHTFKNEIVQSDNEKAVHKPSVTFSSDIKQMYKCRDCTYSTNQPHNLRRHENDIHKPSVKKMYKCQYCTYSSNRSFNLTKHQNAIHKPLVTEKIEYNSTIDVDALKNEIVQSDNEYQTKIELGREIKKIVQELNVNIPSLDKEKIEALELFENHGDGASENDKL